MSETLRNILHGLAETRGLDLLNLGLGVTGVWLMTRRSLWAFPVGLAAVTVQGVLFWRATFYADAKLQIFFFVCLAYGWWHWTRPPTGLAELQVTRLSWPHRLLGLGAAAAACGAWGYWQDTHTDAIMPYRDTFIASFSVLGQIWQVRKHVENWAIWTAVNLVAIATYWSAELAFTAFLYGIYLVLGLLGWRAWDRATTAKTTPEATV